MDLSSILALGQFGLGLFGTFSGRNAYNHQATVYEEQAALNKQIGLFNAEVAERTGVESVKAIAKHTKRLVGEQMVSFSNRGITMEGSPMFVLGDTVSMGSQQAQEAYFNAEVNKVNALYRAYGASTEASARAESAKGSAMAKSLDIFNQFMEGAKMLKLSASSKSTTGKPTIFDIEALKIS